MGCHLAQHRQWRTRRGDKGGYGAVRTVTRMASPRGGSGMSTAVSVNLSTGFPSTLAKAMRCPRAVYV